MTNIAALRDQQREISAIATTIRGMLEPALLGVPVIAKVARELLCELCDRMQCHLAEEHKGLYPALLTHPDHEIKNLAWGFINNDKPLRKEFSDYAKHWLKDCDFDFSGAFISETRAMLEALDHRLDLERNSMLPRLERRGVFAQA